LEIKFEPYIYGSLQWWAYTDSSVSLFLDGQELTAVHLKGQGLRCVGLYAFDRAVISGQVDKIGQQKWPIPFGYHHLNKHPYAVSHSLWCVSALFKDHSKETEQHLNTLLQKEEKSLSHLAFLALCLQEYSLVNPLFSQEQQILIAQKFWDLALLHPNNSEEQALLFLAWQAFVTLFDSLSNSLQIESRSFYYSKERILCYPQSPVGCAYLILANADTDGHAGAFLEDHYLDDVSLENCYPIAKALMALKKEELLPTFLSSIKTKQAKASLYGQGYQILTNLVLPNRL
jgi:hypothetical protein